LPLLINHPLSFAYANQKKNSETLNKISTSSKHSSKYDIKTATNSNQDFILHFQRTIGNQALQRLMHSNIKFDFAKLPTQSKLKISQPGDTYEQEADTVAQQVMRISESNHIGLEEANKEERISCKCLSCEMKKGGGGGEKVKISRKPSTVFGFETSNKATNKINDVLSSHGAPLNNDTKKFMESRFGYDFSNVRIHTDAQAVESAQSLNSLAYTVENDIVFSSGTYMHGTIRGRQLLAHELAHVVQQQKLDKSVLLLQRQPNNPNAGLQDEAKKSVKDTIDYYLETGSKLAVREVDLHGTKTTIRIEIDREKFERTINYLYSSLIQSEDIIDTQLNGDSGLKKQLRSAYISVLSVLMHRAAIDLNMNENDLYRENIGRVPAWAWKKPHYLFPGITSPIPMGVSVNPRTKKANFTLGGFNVIIKPDILNVNLKPKVSAETRFKIRWEKPHKPTIEIGTVTSIQKIKSPTIEIQTSYAPGNGPKDLSGYGRSTIPQDLAGGKITPSSISLGFHEGSHALDFMEFIRNHPPPRFIGKVGDTKAKFDTALLRLENDWETYKKELDEFTNRQTDCVGFTKDQWFDKNASEIIRVHECP